MKKIIRNLGIGTLVGVMTMTSVLYMRDFRYSSDKGIYKITERGSDYTDEERKERHISKDYEARITNLDLLSVWYLF